VPLIQFFIMFFEDFLKDIHRNIIEEARKKRKPHPSRLRGRGVEVSKTLFYLMSERVLVYANIICERVSLEWILAFEYQLII